MELFKIENLTFAYPEAEPVISNINLSVNEGEMLLLLGDSGCGKTTLLKQLKPQLAPIGDLSGSVTYFGKNIREVEQEQTAKDIGYVFQNPQHQIVTDKVWHELAFGLENQHMAQKDMELKIGEVASYFGIQNWFHKKVEELSGGQMQLLNLASILAMDPKVIILDEPTSQLDPIAARNFLEMVYRIKEELGITIIITEHRTEEVYKMADRIGVMDQGKLLKEGNVREITDFLMEEHKELLPVVPKIYSTILKREKVLDNHLMSTPISLLEGRRWLKEALDHHLILEKDRKQEDEKLLKQDSEKTIEKMGKHLIKQPKQKRKKTALVQLKEIYFRYEREEDDIISHLTANIYQGECFGILGGNGVGKTTLLKVIGGMKKPYSGKCKVEGKIGFLSQNPQDMFVKDKVKLEINEEGKELLSLFKMEHLLEQHPYDLSGGEQQRLALLKVLEQNPDILLLDEPTKGMDQRSKQIFGEIINRLVKDEKTIIMVSHDVEFAARYTNRCGLFFDGRLSGIQNTKDFFLRNQYYTTVARRVTKGIIDCVVLEDEL